MCQLRWGVLFWREIPNCLLVLCCGLLQGRIYTHEGVCEWDYFWMKLKGQMHSSSTFTALQSQTNIWYWVHKTSVELVWNNGNLKPQRCVEQRYWTLSNTFFALHMHFHCSLLLADVNVATDSSILLVGLILAYKPSHRSRWITALRNGFTCLRSHGLPHSQRSCCSSVRFPQAHFSSFRSP